MWETGVLATWGDPLRSLSPLVAIGIQLPFLHVKRVFGESWLDLKGLGELFLVGWKVPEGGLEVCQEPHESDFRILLDLRKCGR